MKRIREVGLSCSLLLTCAPVALGQPAQKPSGSIETKQTSPLPPYFGPRKRAVVAALDVKVQGVATTAPTPSGSTTIITLAIDQPTEFGTGLSDMLTTALVASKRFIVLERQNFDDIAKENQLSRTGEFNPATAIAAGRLLGAQVIVRGSITELSVKRSGTEAGIDVSNVLSFGMAQAESKVALDLKIVDATTGQVLESVRAEGKAVSKGQALKLTKADIKIGLAAFENSPLGKAVRAAVEDGVRKIVSRTQQVPWEAKIAEVQTENGLTLFLNVGEDSGLQIGDILEVVRLGAEITDPDTGLVLGKVETKKLGQLRVTELQKNLTLALPIETTEFQRGDVVRFVRRPSAGSS